MQYIQQTLLSLPGDSHPIKEVTYNTVDSNMKYEPGNAVYFSFPDPYEVTKLPNEQLIELIQSLNAVAGLQRKKLSDEFLADRTRSQLLRGWLKVCDRYFRRKPTYEYIDKIDDWFQTNEVTLDAFKNAKALAFDLETYGTHPIVKNAALYWQYGDIRLCQVYNPDQHHILVFDVKEARNKRLTSVLNTVLSQLLLRPSGYHLYGHNAVFDTSYVNRRFPLTNSVTGNREFVTARDTMTASQMYRQGVGFDYKSQAKQTGIPYTTSLNGLATLSKEIGFNVYGSQKKEYQKSDFGLFLSTEQKQYAADDAYVTYQVARHLSVYVTIEGNQKRLEQEWVGAKELQVLSSTGFSIDKTKLTTLIVQHTKALDLINDGCNEMFTAEPTNPQQIRDWMYANTSCQFWLSGSDQMFFIIQKLWVVPLFQDLKQLLLETLEDVAPPNTLNRGQYYLFRHLFNYKLRLYLHQAQKVSQEEKKTERYITTKTQKHKIINRFDLVESLLARLTNSTARNSFTDTLQALSDIALYMNYSQVRNWHVSVKKALDKLNEIDKFSFQVDKKTNQWRVFSNYISIGGDNSYGRTGSKSCALQNIPKPTKANDIWELDPIRAVFMAPPGKVWLRYDYNGCHGQVLAFKANDTAIFDLQALGIKFHYLTTQGFLKRLYNIELTLQEIKAIKSWKPPENEFGESLSKSEIEKLKPKHYNVVKELYDLSKVFYYSAINYAGAASIQNSIIDRSEKIVSLSVCVVLLESLWDTYKASKQQMDKMISTCKQSSYRLMSQTGFEVGIVGVLPGVDSCTLRFGQGFKRGFSPAIITSGTYQNYEGWAIKNFMRVFNQNALSPSSKWFGAKINHHNHDELVLEIPAKDAERYAEEIISCLEVETRKYISTYIGDHGKNYSRYINRGHW